MRRARQSGKRCKPRRIPPRNTPLEPFSPRRYGDLEAVEDFLAVGKDVNEADAEGRSPLHMACATGNPQIIGELLSAGANVAAVDSKKVCLTRRGRWMVG